MLPKRPVAGFWLVLPKLANGLVFCCNCDVVVLRELKGDGLDWLFAVDMLNILVCCRYKQTVCEKPERPSYRI